MFHFGGKCPPPQNLVIFRFGGNSGFFGGNPPYPPPQKIPLPRNIESARLIEMNTKVLYDIISWVRSSSTSFPGYSLLSRKDHENEVGFR
jgi:hypothetical protein